MMVSFLIVNYNALSLIKDAIMQIKSAMTVSNDYEIVVFDNGSNDGSKEWFSNLSDSSIKYIFSSTNLGYGAGCNRAFQESVGKVVVLANPDIGEIRGQLVSFLSQEGSEVGAWGPKIIYPDGKPQANGGGRSTPLTFVFQTLRLGYLVRSLGLISAIKVVASLPIPGVKKSIIGQYLRNFDRAEEPTREWCWMSGAFLAIPRHIFARVGGFDENFFLYNEDEDLCMAIRKLGYKIVQDNSLVVVHAEGATHKHRSGDRLGRAYVERMKSRVYFSKKHFSASAYLLVRLYLAFFTLISAFAALILLHFLRCADFFKLSMSLLLLKPASTERRLR